MSARRRTGGDGTRGVPAPGVVWSSSPRAAEAALLSDLGALLPRSLPALAATSGAGVRVVVPSRTLRRHLLVRIAERLGAVAGVEVATLRQTALALLAAAGERPDTADGLFELFARRSLARERALADWLEELSGGLGPAVASLRDLLDAGFRSSHLAAALEAVDGLGREPMTVRGAALLRAAARLQEATAALPPLRDPDLLRRAAEALGAGAAEVPGCRALLVHGFADATGAAIDLLEALVRAAPARVHLVAGPPGSERFGRHLRERMAGLLPALEPAAAAEPPAKLCLRRHVDPRSEVRATGWAILAELATGTPPERIGVVARRLEPYARFVREEWAALGIPFSSPSPSPHATATGRYLAGFRELLARGARTGIDRWLALRGGGGGEALELRLALHVLGAARIEGAAGLDLDRLVPEGGLPLPLREGIARVEEGTEAEAGESDARPPRRRVARDALAALRAEAAAIVAHFAAWPDRAPAALHAERLRGLLACLAPDPTRGGPGELAAAVAVALADLPPAFAIARDEIEMLLERALAGSGTEPLGGAGGGIQLLDVTAARGLTFERLHLLGLAQGRFPRAIAEDPLLPDPLRRALAPLFPALGAKQDGHAEEVFLFHALLGSAPRVTLNRPAHDEEARQLARSPLLVPALARGELEEVDAAAEGFPPAAPLPLPELALRAGLELPRGAFAPFLEALLAEVDGRTPAAAHALARSHLARLEALDPPPGSLPAALRVGGPLFGGVGPLGADADPRWRLPAATTLEGLARCPWQLFLKHLLAIEPPADAAAGLPSLGSLLVGKVVHAALEQSARRAGAPVRAPLAEALRGPGGPSSRTVVKPTRGAVRRAAEAALREEGLAAWPLGEALARLAQQRLEALPRAAGDTLLVGAELSGECPVEAGGGSRRVPFRVDRVERRGEELVLLDFKTGRPGGDLSGKRPETRTKGLRQAIAEGSRLQAALYAASGAGSGPVRGAYVFLDPETDEEAREIGVTADDDAAAAALAATVDVLSRAWERGVFPPRLLDNRNLEEKPARLCASCEWMDACVQHDSLLRAAFRRRILALRADPGEGSADERLALALFDLGRPHGGDGEPA